ncbi:MAG: site-2 protease family protein [Methanomicrobiales archaeon]|nr:site-2 protease family protein [Methanomicrobiales archaeon]
MGIKTDNVGFFDIFQRFSRGLRAYGTLGVVITIFVSIGMVAMLIASLDMLFAMQPGPTDLHKPQNFLLIPGVNEFVPSTFAVWFAFVLTLIVHEFGHAILCRVERIKVSSMGLLLLVIPIGAFVEPDEKEVKDALPGARLRMYGAGIANNIVIGLLCFWLLTLCIGFATPTNEAVVSGVYLGYPAESAGIQTPSTILSINGEKTPTSDVVGEVLEKTKPGETITLSVQTPDGIIHDSVLTLAAWPDELGSDVESGFMGVYYHNGETVIQSIQNLFSPMGVLYLLVLPFLQDFQSEEIRIVGFEGPNLAYYEAPFPGFWQIIHIFFWAGFINLAVGLFNALPMAPLDGGLIFRDGIEKFLSYFGKERYASGLYSAVTSTVLFMLLATFFLPYLFHI